MRRLLTLMAVFLALLTGSLSTITSVAAQDEATPTTGETSGPVTIYGQNGEPIGEIVVDALIDPFEEYDPSYAPQRGFHYVMASVTVTAGDTAFDASAYGFSLVDTDGFAYTTTFAYRSSEDTEAMPDFAGGTIEAGDSLSGVIFFEVLDGTTTGFVIYQPTYETLLTVADLRDEPVAEGDPVEYISSNNQPLTTITVNGVVSPLKDFDPSYAPDRGFEYAGVEVTIENTGDAALQVDPYSFQLVDAQGFLFYSYGAVRTEAGEAETPSLQSAELAAGDSVTGLVTFQVLSGTEIGLIQYSPSSDRQIRLAEYGAEQAPTPPDSTNSIPTNTNVGVDATPAAGGSPVPQASDEECAPVLEWAQATLPQINAWSEAINTVGSASSADEIDATAVRDAADSVSQAAEDQDSIDTPDLAADANDALVAVFEDTADTLNEIADAAESGDDAALSTAATALFEIGTEEGPGSLDQTFTDLAEACPALNDIGNE